MLNVVLSSWPRGNKGAIKSLEKVAEFISRDRLDPRTKEWTINQLKAAGNPKTDIGKAKVIYDIIKKDKIYVLDPLDSEAMQSALCTLDSCGGITLNGGDCDDLTISFLSPLASVGIPVAVVGHSYDKSGDIGHVLGAFWDNKSNSWILVDTTIDLPFGKTYKPTRERWISVPDGNVICDKKLCSRESPPDYSRTRKEGDFIGIGETSSSKQGTITREIEVRSISKNQWVIFGISTFICAALTTVIFKSFEGAK